MRQHRSWACHHRRLPQPYADAISQAVSHQVCGGASLRGDARFLHCGKSGTLTPRPGAIAGGRAPATDGGEPDRMFDRGRFPFVGVEFIICDGGRRLRGLAS